MGIQGGVEKGTEKYLKYLMAENAQNVTKKTIHTSKKLYKIQVAQTQKALHLGTS